MTDNEVVALRRTLGRNIRLMRLKKGYEDAKPMATRLDVPYTTYVSWERGDRFPRTDKLIMLADLLGVSLDMLFGRENTQISDKFSSLDAEDKLYVYRTIDMLLERK